MVAYNSQMLFFVQVVFVAVMMDLSEGLTMVSSNGGSTVNCVSLGPGSHSIVYTQNDQGQQIMKVTTITSDSMTQTEHVLDPNCKAPEVKMPDTWPFNNKPAPFANQWPFNGKPFRFNNQNWGTDQPSNAAWPFGGPSPFGKGFPFN